MSSLITNTNDSFLCASPLGGRVGRACAAHHEIVAPDDQRATKSRSSRTSCAIRSAVVRNAAGLLRGRSSADGIERARVLIERHVGQMNRHIEDLLDAAPSAGKRMHCGRPAWTCERSSENAVEAIAPDCAQRGHRLVVNLPVEALWMHADSARLEQVFSNLLINAAKYTPDAGEITVTLELLEDHASVRIRDSGIGIAPAQLSRIFEMFVQVDATARHAEGGRGIGLAVVRDLVEMHGGTVEAMSAGLNLGSEFTVLLPAVSGRPRWRVEGAPASDRYVRSAPTTGRATRTLASLVDSALVPSIVISRESP